MYLVLFVSVFCFGDFRAPRAKLETQAVARPADLIETNPDPLHIAGQRTE